MREKKNGQSKKLEWGEKEKERKRGKETENEGTAEDKKPTKQNI